MQRKDRDDLVDSTCALPSRCCQDGDEEEMVVQIRLTTYLDIAIFKGGPTWES